MNSRTRHLLRVFTEPTEANVVINGNFLGSTSPSGLMLLWEKGDRVTVEKAGFEPVKLVCSSSTPQSAITLTLKPLPAPKAQIQPTATGRNITCQETTLDLSPKECMVERPPKTSPRFSLAGKWLALLIGGALISGIAAAWIIYPTWALLVPWRPPTGVSKPPPARDSQTPSATVTLPVPVEPPRPTNIVLVNNEKIDKIITTVDHVLKLTNDERKKKGLPPLQLSAALAFIAQNHAENMCQARTLQDDATVFPDGWKSLDERLKLVGLDRGSENVARERWQEPARNAQIRSRDPNVSDEQLDQLQAESTGKWLTMKWMLSERARKKILDPSWKHVGIGICPGSENAVYAVQVLSTKPGGIR